MIYAKHDGNRTIVGAADTVVELELFIEQQTRGERASVLDMLSDEYLSRFKLPPLIVEHDSQTERDAFAEATGLTIVRSNNLIDRHDTMLAARDEENPPEDNIPDGTTIAQLHGLDKHDPWDKRSDEDKAKDEELRKLYEAAAKSGNLSNDDSFAAPAAAKATVTDIRTQINKDGSVSVNNVLAVKGLHDGDAPSVNGGDEVVLSRDITRSVMGTDTVYEAGRKVTLRIDNKGDATLLDGPYKIMSGAAEGVDYEREQVVDLSSITAEDGTVNLPADDYTIDENGSIPIYHRVDVMGAKLADIDAHIEPLPRFHKPRVMRDSPTGCWLAFVRLATAEMTLANLAAAGFTAAIVGVDSKGQRLAPEGIVIVDTEAEKVEPPRIWNDRADELPRMTDEEKAVNEKSLTGAEFIYCGKYHGPQDGCIIYVTPKSYFDAKKEMYPHSLDIAHILPQDLKEIEPGVYQTKSRDWVSLSFDLGRKGFVESMWLQLHLNNQ